MANTFTSMLLAWQKVFLHLSLLHVVPERFQLCFQLANSKVTCCFYELFLMNEIRCKGLLTSGSMSKLCCIKQAIGSLCKSSSYKAFKVCEFVCFSMLKEPPFKFQIYSPWNSWIFFFHIQSFSVYVRVNFFLSDFKENYEFLPE